MPNTLYYGDNLPVLRQHIPDGSVDLVYLDPPFNSNASYNVLFRERSGEESAAQIKAFTDTWEWADEAARTYEQDIISNPAVPAAVKEMIAAFRQFVGANALMAYLVMMTPRLVELRRVLKPTGSLYLHCDPTASHYLKIVLDTIFGKENFRSEIVWRRSNAHNKLSKQFGPIHDTILFYAMGDNATFHPGHRPHYRRYIANQFTLYDENGPYRMNEITGSGIRTGESGSPWRGIDITARGRHWAIPGSLTEELGLEGLSQHEKLDALASNGDIVFSSSGFPRYKQRPTAGVPHQDIWAYQPYTDGLLEGTNEGIDQDTKWLEDEAERLGYQTQKPEGLLERIIQASSNEGAVVLDPFCGCGTAVVAAEKLNRQWIGIDITHLAVGLMKYRLKTAFNLDPVQDYEVVGEPRDVGSARALAEQDRYQFQFWAVSLLEAQPQQREQRRGADRGIDGLLTFLDGPRRTLHKAVVQVKSGHVSSRDLRDLKGVVEREKAALGLFITLEEPTRDMRTEAASGGFFHSDLWDRNFPKVQIRTVGELLGGQQFELPPRQPMYQAAERVRRAEGAQPRLEGLEGSGRPQ